MKYLEFIQTTVSLRGRAKSSRPRRQVKKARRRSYRYVENVFGRQRRHRALQPTAVEGVVWIHSFMQNKPNFIRFSPENDDFTKKQTQFKPKQTQFWASIKGVKPKQTQPVVSLSNLFKPNFIPPCRQCNSFKGCKPNLSKGQKWCGMLEFFGYAEYYFEKLTYSNEDY